MTEQGTDFEVVDAGGLSPDALARFWSEARDATMTPMPDAGAGVYEMSGVLPDAGGRASILVRRAGAA